MVAPLIAAAALSGFGKLLGGLGGNRAAKRKARALRERANMARAEGGIRAGIELAEGDRVSAAAAVRAAANAGGAAITGSALDVLADLAAQSMHNARTAIYQAQTEAIAAESDAVEVRKEGRMQLVSSVIGGVSSFASAASGAGFGGGGGGSGFGGHEASHLGAG